MASKLQWDEWGGPLALLITAHVVALGWLLTRLARPPPPAPPKKTN